MPRDQIDESLRRAFNVHLKLLITYANTLEEVLDNTDALCEALRAQQLSPARSAQVERVCQYITTWQQRLKTTRELLKRSQLPTSKKDGGGNNETGT